MSDLLDSIIEQRRQDTLDYQEYLAKLLDGAKQLGTKESTKQYPSWADNAGERALLDSLDDNEALAHEIDTVIMDTKSDSWVGHPMKERQLQHALRNTLPNDFAEEQFEKLFELFKARDEYR